MTLFWRPTGSLDVATDPSALPQTGVDGGVASDALARSLNLDTTRTGVTTVRYGSTRIDPAVPGGASALLVMDGYRYALAPGAIYRNGVLIGSGYSTGDWVAVRYRAYNETADQIYASNGVDRVRIQGTTVAAWGIEAPTTAPTTAVGAGSGLSGAYMAKITYCRQVDGVVIAESNPSPASTVRTLSAGSLAVTWVASADTQVTHVRVYRTLTNGELYYHDQDVAVGATTVDSTTADADLGGLLETDHDRPPALTALAGPIYGGYLFGAAGNRLYWSTANEPEHWPATQYVECGAPQDTLRALVVYLGQLYALSVADMWFAQQTSTGIFTPTALSPSCGCFNPRGAIGVEGLGVLHLGPDGVYLYSGGRDSKLTEPFFDPPFQGVSVAGVPAVSDITTAWVAQYGNRVYVHWGAGSLLVYALDTRKVRYYEYDGALTSPCEDIDGRRWLAVDALGYVRHLEDPDATTDAGTAVSWMAQSKDFTLQTRRHFPRWARYDVDAAGATGAVLLDGVVHQTHLLTGGRDTRLRLIASGNGRRCAIRLSGNGPASLYACEME